MCGRYTLIQTEGLPEPFDAENALDGRRFNYNVSPGQAMPVVTRHSPNRLEVMRWGLVPFWAEDPEIGYRMINARAETVAQKPAFWTALKKRRCLVPSTGFYKWRREGELKQPMFIRCTDQETFSFAGL